MRLNLLIIAAASLLLLSCASATSSKPVELNNPYIVSAENHTGNGMASMQKERWDAAIHSFSRALTAAQLADEPALITGSWYNLAAAQSRAGLTAKAENAYTQAIALSHRHGDQTMQLRSTLALRLMQQRQSRLPEGFSLQQLPASLFSKQQWPADLHLQAARLAHRLGERSMANAAYQLVTRSKIKSRNGLKIKAEAHMGLALLARDSGESQSAIRESEQTLSYCRQIGAPRLTAHALLLQAELVQQSGEKQDKLERAVAIYSAMGDAAGQKKALQLLLRESESAGLKELSEQLRLRLSDLEDKLGE